MTVYNISSNAQKIYEETITIRSYHCDVNRQLTLPKLCSFFQDVAGNHTVACGVGWEFLQKNKMFWVLSRLRIEIECFPKWHEQIVIRTWSNGLDGLLAIRHFQVLNNEGNEIIKAISSWLMLNSETRRLIKADEFMRDFPINSERLFESNLAKLPSLVNQVKFVPLEVLFTETDMNRHMNNVSYIDRIINSFGFNYLLRHQIKNFEINFLKEALPGDFLYVQQQQLSKLHFLNNIVRQSDLSEMVRTRFEWI